MPLGTNNTTTTTAAKFIPDLWSDEVIATFKSNLVAADRITKFEVEGKKGTTVHVPNFTRTAANSKTQGSQVTLIAPTHTETTIALTTWYEYSVLIEDIVATQALDSLRQAHTDDAGYALAKQIDTSLIQLGRSANAGAGTAAYANAFIGGDGTTAYTSGAPNNSAITDAAIRRTIQRFDDNDYPMMDRTLLIPPVSRNSMLGISRFTEQAFRGDGGALKSGQFGDIYGVSVFVSTNCDTATGSARIALMFHKTWAGLAIQKAVRSQTQYKQEYLADLFTADVLYGTAELRDTGAIPLAV